MNRTVSAVVVPNTSRILFLLHYVSVMQRLSLEEVTSQRCPMPWGHETAIPERAAVPCSKCRRAVVQEA